jgi:hypothetical protein
MQRSDEQYLHCTVHSNQQHGHTYLACVSVSNSALRISE